MPTFIYNCASKIVSYSYKTIHTNRPCYNMQNHFSHAA